MTDPRRTRARIERGTSITLGAHVYAELAKAREQKRGIDLGVVPHDTGRGRGVVPADKQVDPEALFARLRGLGVDVRT